MLSINIVVVENQSVHNLSLITLQGPIITWLGVASVQLGLKYYVSKELAVTARIFNIIKAWMFCHWVETSNGHLL